MMNPTRKTKEDKEHKSWDPTGSVDTDGEGLPDYIEHDLAKEVRNRWDPLPDQSDVFVEVDWMEGHRFQRKAQILVVNQFYNHDIYLHIDDGCMGGGEEIPEDEETSWEEYWEIKWGTHWNDGVGGDDGDWRLDLPEIDYNNDGGDPSFYEDFDEDGEWGGLNELSEVYGDNHFESDRAGIFHYVLFVNKKYNDEETGGATPGRMTGGKEGGTEEYREADPNNPEACVWRDADDIMVFDGAIKESTLRIDIFSFQAHTFMHELGHTLGFGRRDAVGTIAQPDGFAGVDDNIEKGGEYEFTDYPSVMNYDTPDWFVGYGSGWGNAAGDWNDWERLRLDWIRYHWYEIEGGDASDW